MQQAATAAGVQEQPDCQSQPRQTSAAGALPHAGSKWRLKADVTPLFPSPPLNQGAFKACARVSELQVFTHAAEVKVDPDKPLEGVRLAVLQVAQSEIPVCHPLDDTPVSPLRFRKSLNLLHLCGFTYKCTCVCA